MPNQETYSAVDSLNSIGVQDTLYGVENEELIPIRHTEAIPPKEILKDQLFEPSYLKVGTESWQVFFLVVAVLMLGMAKAFSNNRYKLGLKALIKYAVAQEITREEQVFFHRSNLLLTTAYTLTAALFLYQIRRFILNQNSSPEGINTFLMIVVIIVGVYLVKYIFSKLLLFVFDNTVIGSEYIYNVSLYNNLLGVLLIPVLLISFFTAFPFHNLLIFIAIPIVFLVFALRLFRLFTIGRSRGLLYVYIFLYICTLEILPLVVLYRIFVH